MTGVVSLFDVFDDAVPTSGTSVVVVVVVVE